MNTTRKATVIRDPEQERVGRTIQAFRERLGYTQQALADATSISRPHLANIEAGRKPLSNMHLVRIAAALSLPSLAIKCFDKAELELAA